MPKPDAMTELEIKTRFYVLARRPAPDGTDAYRLRRSMVDDVLDAWNDRRAVDSHPPCSVGPPLSDGPRSMPTPMG